MQRFCYSEKAYFRERKIRKKRDGKTIFVTEKYMVMAK